MMVVDCVIDEQIIVLMNGQILETIGFVSTSYRWLHNYGVSAAYHIT
jgi:hypothetical protein